MGTISATDRRIISLDYQKPPTEANEPNRKIGKEYKQEKK